MWEAPTPTPSPCQPPTPNEIEECIMNMAPVIKKPRVFSPLPQPTLPNSVWLRHCSFNVWADVSLSRFDDYGRLRKTRLGLRAWDPSV